MSDTQLHNLAQSALAGNPHVSRRSVRLEAISGRITLRGRVASFFQKQMAQESLRGIEGLHHIENLLEVHWNSETEIS